MFDVGVPELVLILVVALIVFGPSKLPEVGTSLGKAMKEFRSATQGLTEEIEAAKRSVGPLESDAEMRARLLREQQSKMAAPPAPVVSAVAPATHVETAAQTSAMETAAPPQPADRPAVIEESAIN